MTQRGGQGAQLRPKAGQEKETYYSETEAGMQNTRNRGRDREAKYERDETKNGTKKETEAETVQD